MRNRRVRMDSSKLGRAGKARGDFEYLPLEQ